MNNIENHIENLNNFFNVEINEIYKLYKNKNRDRKIKINDLIKYIFYYSEKNTSKLSASHMSNSSITRTAFHRKLENISYEFFEKIYFKLYNIFSNMLEKDNEITNLHKLLNNNNNINVVNDNGVPFDKCSGDGCCNNKITNGELFTELSEHIYSNTKHIPFYIINNTNSFSNFKNNKNNNSNKNNEIYLLDEFIKKNKNNSLNVIILLDSAYASYPLIEKLINENIKFIIRLRENFHILDGIDDKIDDEIDDENENKNKNITKY